MKYKIKNNIIFVEKSDFNPEHILLCGQNFSYELKNNNYIAYSLDKKAEIIEKNNNYEIHTNDIEYFVNYFDLNTDYSKIKQQLAKHPILREPIKFGHGIRIIKNDKFEMLISFIISANNNIKRIQKIISVLKEKCGERKGDYIAFPTCEQMLTLAQEEFLGLGAGYRAKYLYNVIRQVDRARLEEWDKLNTAELRKKLIGLSGVGPKVADCILLFGYYRQDVFPVDTWIEQMYNQYIDPNEHNRNKIRDNLVQMFGDLSGYAQQYLFYYQRSGKEEKV